MQRRGRPSRRQGIDEKYLSFECRSSREKRNGCGVGSASRQRSTMIDQIRENLLRILFPPRCSGCGDPIHMQPNQKFCSFCAARVVFITSPLCPACGIGVSSDGGYENRFCPGCLQQRPAFDSARSLVYYRDPVRSLLHQLKFKADTRAVIGLRSVIDAGGDWYRKVDYDLIVPVPLFPTRLRKRGLNQALVLARLFFLKESVKIDPTALIKAENTSAQSELSGIDRRKNLAGTIRVRPGTNLAGMKICVVDDIFTTGTTVSECSLILKENGAKIVEVLTFARA